MGVGCLGSVKGQKLLWAWKRGDSERCPIGNNHLNSNIKTKITELNTYSSLGLKRKVAVKTLPNIKENVEVTKVSYSRYQSHQVNAQETTDLEKKVKVEESTELLKESLIINFESKESLKNTEVTSSAGMTLPTGVSTFLLECLDVGSTADYNTGTSDSLNSCSSPETFRDDGPGRSNFYAEDSVMCKNSTLLDSSKAVSIDKIPQISNLSAILEPALGNLQDQHIQRKRPPSSNYSFSALSVSTTLAGKKVCKIRASRERTPDPESGMRCSSPLGLERKADKRTPNPKRLKRKKKENNTTTLEGGTSSSSQHGAPGRASAKLRVLTAKVLLSRQTDTVVQISSIVEENKAQRNPGYARPAEVDPLCDRQEICSIVRTSPRQRPSRLPKIPVNTKVFQPPKEVPEDIITSTKNWIYCKHR
ncbi:meiosis-specific kinetochore protein [Athene cunicularia]|uniref:meiosis-specific kinetochore protein n=1 Tax=Athene cunicularia TaxID=194338 RepID=UPI000EF75888|nr:meiosis-specific kinetochore protein [Athene cunicularia]